MRNSDSNKVSLITYICKCSIVVNDTMLFLFSNSRAVDGFFVMSLMFLNAY